MKIPRERIDFIRRWNNRDGVASPQPGVAVFDLALKDLLTALDEVHEMLADAYKAIRPKHHPMRARIADALRGTKWEKANG